MHRLEITAAWDGGPLEQGEWARARLVLPDGLPDGLPDAKQDEVLLEVEAGFYGDPPPPAPGGRLDGLWDHEVVELFLLGRDEAYLEIELGPHGHWLGLRLSGRRRVADHRVPIAFRATRQGARWRGAARFAAAWLPPGLCAANFYSIHGVGPARRFLAMAPVPGEAPDFHRLEHFPPLAPHSGADR